MNISIITPGAKGGYGEGISKYNTNLVDYFIKKDEYKKIHLFSRTSTNYKNSKINNISEENIIIFSVRLLINHFNLMRSDMIFISHINLIMFCIFPILSGEKSNFIKLWPRDMGHRKKLFI